MPTAFVVFIIPSLPLLKQIGVNTRFKPSGASGTLALIGQLITAMVFHDISLVRFRMTLSKLKAHKIPIYFLWHYDSA